MKKFLLILPAFVLLAAACNQQPAVQQNTQTPTQPVQATPPPQNQTQTPPVNDNTNSWKTYMNSRFVFSLIFTDAWKGYKVFSSEGSQGVGAPTYLDFSLPTTDKSRSVINVIDNISGYAAPLTITIIAKDRNYQGTGVKITEDNDNAYYYSINKDLPKDLQGLNFEISKIISTFKFTNPTANNNSAKTYTSNYGYQFTYASDYILEASSPIKVGLRNKSDNSTDVYGNKVPADIVIEYFSDLTKLPYYQTNIKNLDDYVAQSGSAKSMYNITSYKNKNGVLVYSFTDAGLKSVHTELMLHNNHYYQISFFKRETGDQLSALENDVLKSFVFTK